MHQSKLFDLVASLTKHELLRFGKFVRSPFFTHRTDVGLMFAVLAQCRYRQKSFPDKETLFREAFPNEPAYDDLKLRGAMSDLCGLLEQFMSWQHYTGDALTAEMGLMDQFSGRNLVKQYEQKAKQVKRTLAETPFRNAEYHRDSLDFLLKTGQFMTLNKRTVELPLQEISDALDTLYLAQKLRHACTQLSHQAVYRSSYGQGLLPYVLDQVENGGYLSVPAVALYYYCYRFMTEQYSLAYFRQFRTELLKNEARFPAHELKTLYLFATNFCIRKLNEGNEPFVREGWDIYQEGLARGFLVEHGRISAFTFNNIVAFGIKLEVYGEVEAFIEQYRGFLDPAQQQRFVDFNRARLEYKRGNLSEALRLLQTADFKDLVNNLIAKTLLIKIYFQLREFEILDSHLDSFRQFISRRELSDYHRLNYSNIIGIVRKMMALSPKDRAGKKALAEKVRATEVLTEREWILEQLM